MKKIEIQSFSSRGESIRQYLSQMSWNRGLSNFFIEDIPFSFSTGKVFSALVSQIVENFIDFLSSSKNRPIFFEEMGAGIGYFSKHLLDHLKSHNPQLYKKINGVVSDSSLELVEWWKKENIFSAHCGKIELKKRDVFNSEFKTDAFPDVIFWSYLVSSLPSREILWDGNSIFEIKYRSFINANLILLNNNNFFPEILEGDRLYALVKNYKKNSNVTWIDRLIPNLIEEEKRFPLENVLNDGSSEYKIIEKICRSLLKDETGVFNFSWTFFKSISDIFAHLNENNLIILHDFGFHSLDQRTLQSKPYGKFGNLRFSSVFFPYIKMIADENGLNSYLTNCQQGNDQIHLISKSDFTVKKKSFLIDLFKTFDSGKAKKTLSQVKKKGMSMPANMSIKKIVNHAFKKCTPFEKESYFLLVNLGVELFEAGEFGLAINYLEKSLINYASCAVPTYLLLGKTYFQLKKYKLAEKNFLKAINISPNYSDAYPDLLLLYLEEERYQAYLNMIPLYVKCSYNDNYWYHLLVYGNILLKLGRKGEGIGVIKWVIKIKKKDPSLVPDQVSEKAVTILKHYKNL